MNGLDGWTDGQQSDPIIRSPFLPYEVRNPKNNINMQNILKKEHKIYLHCILLIE